MFCILCLCIILCVTSKASENLTFVLKQSLILSSVLLSSLICCLGAIKIKDSVEQITLVFFKILMCLRKHFYFIFEIMKYLFNKYL